MKERAYCFARVSSLAFGLLALAGCSSAGSPAEAVGTTASADHASNSDPGNVQIIGVTQAGVTQTGGPPVPVILMNQNRDSSLFSGYTLNCPNLGGLSALETGAGFNPASSLPTFDVANDSAALRTKLGAALYPAANPVEAISDIWGISCNTPASNFFYIDFPGASGGATQRKYFVYLGHDTTNSSGATVHILHNVGCGELLAAMGLQLSQASPLGVTNTSYTHDDIYDISCASGTTPSAFVPSLQASLTEEKPGPKPGNPITMITLTPVDMPADAKVVASPGGTCTDPVTGSSFLQLNAVVNPLGEIVGQVTGIVPLTFPLTSCTQAYSATSASTGTQSQPVTITIDIARLPHGVDEIVLAGVRGSTTMPFAVSNYTPGTASKSFAVTNADVTNGNLTTVFSSGAAQYGMEKLAGDFDGDGHTDVALLGAVGASSIPVAFARSGGAWEVDDNANAAINGFAAEAAKAGVHRLVGDFDGDGKSDIVLTGNANFGGLPIAFSEGGDNWNIPALDPQTAFATLSSTARTRFIGDFDGDGKTDIALAPQQSWGTPTMPIAFSRFSNANGVVTGGWSAITAQPLDSTFAAQLETPGAELLTGDFDGDGQTDVALSGPSSWTSIPVALSSAKKDGTWTIPTVVMDPLTAADAAKFAALSSALGVKRLVGDFDGDGQSDIALTGPRGWTQLPVALSRLKGGGSWKFTFSGAATFAAEAGLTDVTRIVGDFNRDGWADIALTGHSSWQTIPVALSRGDGTFTTDEWALDDSDFAVWSTAANRDNAAKLVGYAADARHLAAGDPQPAPSRRRFEADEVLINGGWSAAKGANTYIPRAIANGNGSWTVRDGFVEVSNRPPRGRFSQPAGTDFESLAGPGTQQFDDFNGDGRTDIALTGGNGWTTAPVAFATDGDWDVHNDVNPDNPRRDTPAPAFAAAAAINAFRSSGDFDGDGKSDLMVAGGEPSAAPIAGPAPIAFSNGDGTWRTPAAVNLPAEFASQIGTWEATGDFNGDGKTDVVALAMNGGPAWATIPVAFSNGDGTWTAAESALGVDCNAFLSLALTPNTSTGNGVTVLTGDFNGDGKTDLALTGSTAFTTLPIAFSTGDGRWTCTNSGFDSTNAFAAWSATAGVTQLVGDFNNDGQTDIALTGGAGWWTIPIAFANGDGTFHVTNLGGGSFPSWSANTYRVFAGDFNHDGRADIGVVGFKVNNAESTMMPLAFSVGDGNWTISTNGDLGSSDFLSHLVYSTGLLFVQARTEVGYAR